MKRLTPVVLLFALAVLLPGSFPIKAGSKQPPRLCGTVLSPEDAAYFKAKAMKEAPLQESILRTPPANVCIPISVHIVRKTDGTGGISLNQFYKGLQDCNTKYTGTGLHFVIHDIIYLDSDHFYNEIDTDGEIDDLVDNNPVANTINVYCTPNLSDELGGLCGRGSFTTSAHQGIALNNDCVGVSDNDSSFPHEMGHYLDLFHTHETAMGAELVDESNCTTAGDLLCDTPADPNLTGKCDNSCTYTGTVKDANNAVYHPDTHAIMSYAPKLCRDTFSPQSQARLLNTLNTNPKRTALLNFGCPPDANAGTDITKECTGSSTTSAQLDGSASSDPDGDTITYKWSAAGVTFDNDTAQKPTGGFVIGTTTVRLIVKDTEAYADTDYVDVTIHDTTAPTVSCPLDTTVECSSHCGVAKADIASWLAEASSSDTCDPTATVGNDAPTCFPEGETTVKFKSEDVYGNADSCTAKVTVVDTTPPVIDIVMDRNVLWPPNHKLVECCATVTVTDVCDPNPTFVLYSVASDEPDNDKGDGSTINDIQDADTNTADVCMSLRSERMGGGDGRHYTIIYKATDGSNNVAYDTTCVCVPHDMSAGAVCATGFNVAGTGLQNNVNTFALVIPGTSALSVFGIDEKNIYVGNTAGSIKAINARRVDINNDGKADLAALFTTTNPQLLAALSGPTDADVATFSVDDGSIDTKAVINDGPVGLHFATKDGVNYLVSNIYALGAPVSVPDAPLKDPGKQRPGVQTLPGGQSQRVAQNARITTLSSVHPNPFNPETTVDFSLAASSDVTIAVFDVRGALVKVLVDGTQTAGDHSVRWNGVDEAGRSAASGIYFVRMIAGSYSEVRKIVMLK
jgi:FlgD Ig-like domain/K319L-like, PKD domain/HYR domain